MSPLKLAAAIALLSFIGCTSEDHADKIQPGGQVTLHFELTVDGKVVDSSRGKDPMTFTQGRGQILPGLDRELLGLQVGDKKNIVLTPEKGYGVRNPKALQTVPRNSFGAAADIKEGALVVGQSGGKNIQALILKVGKDSVTLDLNHPLAGKTLHFDIEIIAITPTS